MRVSTLFILIISHVLKPTHMAPIFTGKINEDTDFLKNSQTFATSENDFSKKPSTDDQEGSGYFEESFQKTENPEIKESTLQSEILNEDIKFTSGYSDDGKNYSLNINFNEFENSIENLLFSNFTNQIDDEDFRKNIGKKVESDELPPSSTEKNNNEKFTTEKIQREKENSNFSKTEDVEAIKLSNVSPPKSILSISFSISEDKKSQIDIKMDKEVDEKRYGETNDTFSHKSFSASQNSIFLLFNFGNYYYINAASLDSKIENESSTNSTCTERATNVDDTKVQVDEGRRQNIETTSTVSTANDAILNIGTQSTIHNEGNEVSVKKPLQDKKEFSIDQKKFTIMKTRFIDTDDQENESDDEDYIILEGSGWYNEEKYQDIKSLEKSWYHKLRMKREL